MKSKEKNKLDVDIESLAKTTPVSVLDVTIEMMILDSIRENDESLKRLEKLPFDPNTPIEELNVRDSLVLKLAYLRK